MNKPYKNIFLFSRFTLISLIFFSSYNFLSANGTSWQKEYRINANLDSYTNCIIQSSDNNFISAGYALRNPLPNNILILKVNGNGDTLWTRKFNNVTQSNRGLSIVNTQDNGVIICGSGPQLFLIKYSNNGDLMWFKQYDFESIYLYKIKMVNDGNFVACGVSQNDSAAIFKFDVNGNIIWNKFFNSDAINILKDFIEINGKITFIGRTVAANFNQFVYFLQTDLDGNVISQNNLSVASSPIWDGEKIFLRNNYFKIFGTTFNTNNGLNCAFYFKVDGSGSVFDSKVYTDIIYNELLFDVINFNDREVFLTNMNVNLSTTYSKFTLIDTIGNVIKKLPLNTQGYNSLNSLFKINNSEFISAGSSELLNNSPEKPFLIKTDTSFFIKTSITNTRTTISDFSIKAFPNPFNSSTNIQFFLRKKSNLKFDVFDVRGKLINTFSEKSFNEGMNSFSYNQSYLSSGVFFLAITINKSEKYFYKLIQIK